MPIWNGLGGYMFNSSSLFCVQLRAHGTWPRHRRRRTRPEQARAGFPDARAMCDESEHRITPAWARIAPRLNSLGRVVAFRAIPMASFSCQAHIRRACDAGVRVLLYGRRRQERRGQGVSSGGVSWSRSGRSTMVVGSRGAVRRDAHKSRAWRPWTVCRETRLFVRRKDLPTS